MVYFAGIARAQNIDPARLQAVQDMLSDIQDTLGSLPDAQRDILSSGSQNVLKLAHAVQDGLVNLDIQQPQPQHLGQPLPPDALVSRVNDPGTDFLYSTLWGFTQSETSTAWCGDNLVVGFNDSGSVAETLPIPTIGLSFSGGAYSRQRQDFPRYRFHQPGSKSC